MIKGKQITEFTIEEQKLIDTIPIERKEEIKAKFEEEEYAKSEVSLEQKQDMEPTKQENKSSRTRFANMQKADVSAIIAGKDKISSVKMIYETPSYTYNPETNSITKKDETKLIQSELFGAMEEFRNKYPYTVIEEGNTGFDYLEIGEFKIFGLPTTIQNSEIIFNNSNLQITKGNDWIMDKLEGADKTRFEQFLKRYC